MDAGRITGLSDGDAVTTWSDLSGNGNNATQATADNKPIYKVSIINGRAIVRFDGLNDCLQTPAISLTTHTAFLVVDVSTLRILIEHGPDAAATNGMGIFDNDYTIAVSRGGVVNYKNAGASWTGTDPVIVALTYGGTGATHTLRMNGAAVSLTNPSAGEPGTGSYSAVLNIGARNGGASLPTTGDFAEVLLYSPSLSAQSVARCERYFSAKYAVALA